jgi:hypothetical protein
MIRFDSLEDWEYYRDFLESIGIYLIPMSFRSLDMVSGEQAEMKIRIGVEDNPPDLNR